MKYRNIIDQLPYTKPFLFVGELKHVDENGVEGTFTFSKEMDFYRGHFKDHPVTPGVVLTECCAQIGLVCLGIFLMDGNTSDLQVALSSSEMEFYLPVYPSETVTVKSAKEYFRFNKLKCGVRMYNSSNELVCKGVLAGMIKSDSNGQ